MINEQSTLEDICFAVSAALDKHGITGVLTGGSAASIYAPHAYTSFDADFVLDNDDPLGEVAAALETIGFHRKGRSRIFAHEKARYTVDFPKGPLAIANDYITETRTIERGNMHLRILTRKDCVRDRLCHFYFWDDYTALNAAVAVAAGGIEEPEMERLRAWTERASPESIKKFEEFERRVSAAKGL